jgi:hypothetical protein
VLLIGWRLWRRLHPPFDPDDPKNWLSLDYIEQVTQAQMARQVAEWDLIDGRLRLVLGVVGIVFAAVLGFQRGQAPLEFHVAVLAQLAVGLFLAAGIVAVVGFWPRSFNWPPDPEDLFEYLTTEPEQTKRDLVDSMIFRGYNLNERKLRWKVRIFQVAFLLTTLAVAMLAVALFFHIEAQSKSPDCSQWPSLLRPVCRWFVPTGALAYIP